MGSDQNIPCNKVKKNVLLRKDQWSENKEKVLTYMHSDMAVSVCCIGQDGRN